MTEQLFGRVFRQEPGGPDPEYTFVADEYEADGEQRVRLFRYTGDAGFLAETREARAWFDALRDSGHWVEVEALPEYILKQVSGDEVPSEHSG
jgi:hypothetical protein